MTFHSSTADQSEHDWKSDNEQFDESSTAAATARDGCSAAESIYEPTTSEFLFFFLRCWNDFKLSIFRSWEQRRREQNKLDFLTNFSCQYLSLSPYSCKSPHKCHSNRCNQLQHSAPCSRAYELDARIQRLSPVTGRMSIARTSVSLRIVAMSSAAGYTCRRLGSNRTLSLELMNTTIFRLSFII